MDPPCADSYTNRDPPSAYDNYIQNRRQQSKNVELATGSKSNSTIRFSNILEVHTKQPPNHKSDTPTRSILRTNSKGNKVSTKSPRRRKDSLLEKLKQKDQDEENKNSSRKIEPPGPVRPRKDWNIESLFPSADERKQGSRQMMKRTRMIDPSGGIHTRVSKHEQFYSSEYLLNKYAAESNRLQRAHVDGFISTLNVNVSPCSSPESFSTGDPSPPKGTNNQYRSKSTSDSKSNQRLPPQRHFPTTRIGRKKELSYLQLEERNPYEDDPEFNINRGYDLGRLIQRYPVDSPKSSVASYDDILIMKSTSDTDFSDDEMPSKQKRFDWDTQQFDNRDFQLTDSKRPRRMIKKWAVWFLVGAVSFCFASTFIVYLTMIKGREEKSISSDKLSVEECANHDHTNGRLVSDRYNAIRYELLFQSAGNITMMDQPGSPQRQALCWISEFDKYNINATSGNEEAIIQRYSLAVIYFSTIKEFKNSRSDFDGSRNTNLLSPLHECDWDDIICNQSREVTILRLSRKSLSGSIPIEIGNLENLNFIDLSLNDLTGEIPASITRLTSLEYLSLAFNGFESTIPTFLGRMTSLNTLNLRSSEFLGEIPTEIEYLSYLELLLLDDNSLSGTIPRELGSIFRAQQINLRGNNLSGTVPNELCDLRYNRTLLELEVDDSMECSCCT